MLQPLPSHTNELVGTAGPGLGRWQKIQFVCSWLHFDLLERLELPSFGHYLQSSNYPKPQDEILKSNSPLQRALKIEEIGWEIEEFLDTWHVSAERGQVKPIHCFSALWPSGCPFARWRQQGWRSWQLPSQDRHLCDSWVRFQKELVAISEPNLNHSNHSTRRPFEAPQSLCCRPMPSLCRCWFRRASESRQKKWWKRSLPRNEAWINILKVFSIHYQFTRGS